MKKVVIGEETIISVECTDFCGIHNEYHYGKR